MIRYRLMLFGLVLALALSGGASRSQAGLRVVATLPPVHSLVAGVMAEVGAPKLLLPGNQSPHGYALRPSQARALSEADVIFWIGPSLEATLERPLQTLAPEARIATLTELPGLTLLTYGQAEQAPRGSDPAADAGLRGRTDPHIWLDPQNARVIVEAAATVLAELDPENAERYERNARRVAARLDALEAELRARLEPIGATPYFVFHGGYGYLEHRYGLTGGEAITLSSERRPGARRLAEVRERIIREKVRCVFAEPQFSLVIVAVVIHGTEARTATLDPLGAGLPPGPEAYFAMMRANAEAIATCLAD